VRNRKFKGTGPVPKCKGNMDRDERKLEKRK
jgi:hypothetical protein